MTSQPSTLIYPSCSTLCNKPDYSTNANLSSGHNLVLVHLCRILINSRLLGMTDCATDCCIQIENCLVHHRYSIDNQSGRRSKSLMALPPVEAVAPAQAWLRTTHSWP